MAALSGEIRDSPLNHHFSRAFGNCVWVCCPAFRISHKNGLPPCVLLPRMLESVAMKALLVGALALFGLAGAVRADVIYQFNVDATAGIENFSFSFTVPSLLTDGQAPAFTPFTVTDGTHSWTIVNGLAGVGAGPSCFLFDTGGSSNINDTCGMGVGSSPDGVFGLVLSGGLPTATGGPFTFSSGLGIFDFPDGQDIPSLSGTLTISSAAPEPATIGLVGVALAALAWKRTERADKRES